MSRIFTPEISRLVNVGREVALGGEENLPELKKASREAVRFLEQFKDLFDFFKLSFESDEKVATSFERIGQDIRDLEKLFADLERVIEKKRFIELNPVMFSLEKVFSRLSQDVEELNRLGLKDSPQSPFPMVNFFIKTGYSVAEEKAPAAELEKLFPALITFVSYIEADCKRFEVLHSDEKEMIETGKKLIRDLQESCGALLMYLQEGRPLYLVDGLRILKFASSALYILLRKMDYVAKSSLSFSQYPALEELYHSYELWKKDSASWETVELARRSVASLSRFYNETFLSIEHLPHFPFLSALWYKAQPQQQKFMKEYDAFMNALLSKSKEVDFSAFRDGFESWASAVSRLVTKMEEEINIVKDAPFIEEFKEIVGRFLSGGLVLEYFSHRLESFIQNQQEILYQFKGSNKPLVMEVCELLEQQNEGLSEMTLFLEDSDRSHLISGMQRFEAPLPRLLEIHKSLTGGSEDAAAVSCLTCGASNSQRSRECKKCGTILPLAIDENQMEEPLPSNLNKLATAFEELEKGGIGEKEFLGELKSYKNMLSQIKKEFESKQKLFMKSPKEEIREYAQSFQSGLAELEEAVSLMENSDIAVRESGLGQLRAVGYRLEDLRRMVKDVS